MLHESGALLNSKVLVQQLRCHQSTTVIRLFIVNLLTQYYLLNYYNTPDPSGILKHG